MLQLGSNLYLMNHVTSSASLLQMTGAPSYGGGAGIDTSFGGSYSPQLDLLDHVRWGFGDNQPNLMRKLIIRNTMVRSLLESLRVMILRQRRRFFKRSVDAKGQPQLVPYGLFSRRMERGDRIAGLFHFRDKAARRHGERLHPMGI